MKSKQINSQSGFTLIELLVVISIMMLLSSIIMVGVSSARKSARDAYLKANVKAFENAVRLYGADNAQYPSSTYANDYLGVNIDECHDNVTCSMLAPFAELRQKGYLTNIPAPAPGSEGGGYFWTGVWYIQKAKGKQQNFMRLNNCAWLGSACGFGKYTYNDCVQAAGDLPNGAQAQAAIVFWPEKGQTTDFAQTNYPNPGWLGTGNVICLY